MVDQVQLDLADGKFVPVKTWADPEVLEKNCQINVELHLMVNDPLLELQKWTATENINRVLIHLESPQHMREAVQFALDNGWEVGLVLNPETPLAALKGYLDKIHSVVFMGVVPGKQGQKLIPAVVIKMKNFTSQNPTIFTEIDGGVNEKILPLLLAAGIKAICPGSAIFGSGNPADNVKKLREIINKLTSNKKQDTISK